MCTKKYTKVKDHDHLTGKCRDSAHQICSVFIDWRKIGHDGHLIMQEICKFNKQKNVIVNGVEKYVAFMLGKNLVFIDSMQFMNSNLETLVKTLPKDKFNYLTQEFRGKWLRSVK